VVDDAGHLLAFAGMDGTKLSSVKVPLTKAPAAALRRTVTAPSPATLRLEGITMRCAKVQLYWANS